MLNVKSGDTAEGNWSSDWTLDKSTFCVGGEEEGHEKWRENEGRAALFHLYIRKETSVWTKRLQLRMLTIYRRSIIYLQCILISVVK